MSYLQVSACENRALSVSSAGTGLVLLAFSNVVVTWL